MTTSKPVKEAETHARQRELVDLFRALEVPLLGFAYQMVKNEQIAQDIVQDAFVRLQAHLGEVRQPRAWLYTTVRRLAIDGIRKSRKVVPFSSEGEGPDLEPVDPAPLPDAAAEADERTGLMRVCLERLEVRERTLVQLKFIENLSYKEIAARMGMTVGHVGYRLHHALKALEGELNKEGIAK